jgi:hypothetical protein
MYFDDKKKIKFSHCPAAHQDRQNYRKAGQDRKSCPVLSSDLHPHI